MGAIFLSAQTAPTDKGVNFYSLAREIEIGRAFAEEFARRVTVLRGAEVNEYLRRWGPNCPPSRPVSVLRTHSWCSEEMPWRRPWRSRAVVLPEL